MKTRLATPDDVDIIAGFNQAMALETENKHLPDDVIRTGVRRLLEDAGKGFYLVAEINGDVCACLGITYEWSDWRNGRFWWIQSVFVRADSRRQGAFRALYDTVSEIARNDPDACGLRLYVERDNLAAQQTYLRSGMAETHYKLFETEFS